LSNKVKILGIAIFLVALNSTALTLGSLRGVALIGHPLDVTVPVQLGEGEDAAPCFLAEVFHADIRQESNRVRVLTSPAKDQTIHVRIVSSAVVDEPVVTINLQAGCSQKTSRRYVLLADVSSEAGAFSEVRPLPLVTVTPEPLVPRPVAPPLFVNEKTTRANQSKKPAKPTESVAAKSKATRPVDQIKPQRPAGQSRLKLDPLELFSDRVAGLDSFMTFDLPEDALRNTQRLQTLEASVKSNLALAAKNDASIADLKLRLEKAESERVPAEWLYGLIALALAGLAGVAYLLFRQRSLKGGGDDWMKGADHSPVSELFDPVLHAAPKPGAKHGELDFELPEDIPHGVVVSEFNPHHEPMAEVDVDLVEMSDSKFDSFMTTGAELHLLQSPLASKTADQPKKMALNLNAEATFDIRQQAEFFVSLGQTSRAIRILKKIIDSGEDANPLVYLDLLGLYHSVKQKVEFQELREEFNSLFSGVAPEFSMFKNEGSDLEFYAEALNRISDLWPTPKVLALIESYVFQDPRNPRSRSFALTAFRELLLLHAVAQIMGSPSPSEATQNGGVASANAARKGDTSFEFSDVDFAASAKPASPVKASGKHDALDLDLSDLIQGNPAGDLDTSLDFDFPLLVPEGQASPDADNSIKFDLPMPSRKA
jgi:pilus assembly protein FimV